MAPVGIAGVTTIRFFCRMRHIHEGIVDDGSICCGSQARTGINAYLSTGAKKKKRKYSFCAFSKRPSLPRACMCIHHFGSNFQGIPFWIVVAVRDDHPGRPSPMETGSSTVGVVDAPGSSTIQFLTPTSIDHQGDDHSPADRRPADHYLVSR